MPTAVLTDRERTAVQAYLRLLHTVRAAFGDEFGETGGDTSGPPHDGLPPTVPPAVLAEADRALAEAGLLGHEAEFFELLGSWCPTP
ncbi:hypothetical protein [Streptomyces sp. NPDC002588]|uniref:hypothetical protein n=1 Tax=Streptomyces sp. NPDC002588 TaxID=3154419 RepID=UPI00331F4573